MEYVILTGMSGAGKSTALKVLEDNGYFCMDNLPVPLLEKFIEIGDAEDSRYTKVAIGIDIRSGSSPDELLEQIQKIRTRKRALRIVFLDASDEALVKRYKETRRSHPLAGSGRIMDGISLERLQMEYLRREADCIIDTSRLRTNELSAAIENIIFGDQTYHNLFVTVMSFGFKYGLPQDADLVFDVRFLPNPFYIDELKEKTGNDAEVADYVMRDGRAGEFLRLTEELLAFLIPNYVKEGKNRLVIAIGCTGGHHRSVTIANALYQKFLEKGDAGVHLIHRDIPAAEG